MKENICPGNNFLTFWLSETHTTPILIISEGAGGGRVFLRNLSNFVVSKHVIQETYETFFLSN